LPGKFHQLQNDAQPGVVFFSGGVRAALVFEKKIQRRQGRFSPEIQACLPILDPKLPQEQIRSLCPAAPCLK
jgi:hypothetical protein